MEPTSLPMIRPRESEEGDENKVCRINPKLSEEHKKIEEETLKIIFGIAIFDIDDQSNIEICEN